MRPDASDPNNLSSSDKTRAALIRAGLALFGEKGFAATSTREIAAMANANIGSIAYHFGGKEGLRDACASQIVETMNAMANPFLDAMPVPEQPHEAEAMLLSALERMTGFVLATPEAGRIVQFVLRELQQPTRALDIIYSGVFEKVHRRLCEVWAVASGGHPDNEATRIAVFTVIGQVIYFRIGREAVLRRMGWDQMGMQEAKKIAAIVAANISASLSALRSDPS